MRDQKKNDEGKEGNKRKKTKREPREIPLDLVIEILMRLPAKSLMRFKTVSKLWSSLICSKYFTDRFLKVSSSTPRLYMWLGFDDKKVLLSSSASDVTTMTSSFSVDQDLTIPTMEGYKVTQVFRGLMCFVNKKRAQIYNTTTRQLVVLPDLNESKIISENHKPKSIMYRVGHDPVHDQYKVVCIVSSRRIGDDKGVTYMSEHWVFILGGHVSSRWRKIPSRCQAHYLVKQGLTINGRVYYLARAHLPYPMLVSFDMVSEEISMLPLPEYFLFFIFIDLIECGGRVALLDQSELEDEGVIELRVLRDAEKNRWSKKTLELHPSQMHVVSLHMVDNMGLRAQGTTRNGEVIFVPENKYYNSRTGKSIAHPQNTSLFYVFLYNIEKNHMRKVEIMESSNRYQTKIWDVIGF